MLHTSALCKPPPPPPMAVAGRHNIAQPHVSVSEHSHTIIPGFAFKKNVSAPSGWTPWMSFGVMGGRFI